MLSGLQDTLSNHVGRDIGVRGDLEEAYASLTTLVRFIVRFQYTSAHPSVPEDLGSICIIPVKHLGMPAQLDRRRQEKPQQASGYQDDQRNTWILGDIARFLEMPARHLRSV
jgi:hypothetical protein